MICAFMVSVNYADYLTHTLPYTKRFADKVVVITSHTDYATHAVALEHDVFIHCSDLFNASFKKGAAINEAMQLFKPQQDAWLLHLDSDICIFNEIDTELLSKDTLYGAQRYSVRGRRAWQLVRQRRISWESMRPCSQDAPFLHPSYRIRSRIRRRRLLPPGFFQLWHSSMFADYPAVALDASLDDMLHAERFEKTDVLPNFGVYHLESSDHDLKANWNGRTTGLF